MCTTCVQHVPATHKMFVAMMADTIVLNLAMVMCVACSSKRSVVVAVGVVWVVHWWFWIPNSVLVYMHVIVATESACRGSSAAPRWDR